MTVVVAVLSLVAVIAIPNLMRSRNTSQTNVCIANLRQVNSAIQQWAIENNKPSSASVTSDKILPYIRDLTMPACPGGGTYTLTTVGAPAKCSLSTEGHSL